MSERGMTEQEQMQRAHEIAKKTALLMEGQGPDVPAIALADLTATWVSSFYPAAHQAEKLELFIATLRHAVAAKVARDQSPPGPSH